LSRLLAASKGLMENYQRLRILGRGSFATVVLAQVSDDKRGSTLRVIKEVDLAHADDKRRKDALYEAELLKSLSHPNVVAYRAAHLADARFASSWNMQTEAT